MKKTTVTATQLLERLNSLRKFKGLTILKNPKSKTAMLKDIEILEVDIGLEKIETNTGNKSESTPSGRLSRSGPNLQNIPIRTPESKEIRASFVPEKEKQFSTEEMQKSVTIPKEIDTLVDALMDLKPNGIPVETPETHRNPVTSELETLEDVDIFTITDLADELGVCPMKLRRRLRKRVDKVPPTVETEKKRTKWAWKIEYKVTVTNIVK